MKAITALEPATSNSQLAANEITDPRGYAQRWGFSKRKVSDLLANGLPHLKIGSRRVRICIPEADAWMKERFGTQRRSQVTKDSGA